jgi:hypothetical protein
VHAVASIPLRRTALNFRVARNLLIAVSRFVKTLHSLATCFALTLVLTRSSGSELEGYVLIPGERMECMRGDELTDERPLQIVVEPLYR